MASKSKIIRSSWKKIYQLYHLVHYIRHNLNLKAPGDPDFDTLSTLPANWETRNRRSNVGLGKTYENIFDYLAPQRGGFIWPGTLNKF